MPNDVIIAHKVEDVDRWLGYKEERAAVLSQFGSNVTDHLSMDGYPFISVSIDVLTPPGCGRDHAASVLPMPVLRPAVRQSQ